MGLLVAENGGKRPYTFVEICVIRAENGIRPLLVQVENWVDWGMAGLIVNCEW